LVSNRATESPVRHKSEESNMKGSIRTLFATALALCALATGVTAVTAEESDGSRTYAVTITNITRGQILSPPVVIAHDDSYRLFVPGEAASPELAALAEDAVSGPLLALLGTTPSVFDSNIGGGVVLPGDSMTVEVEVRGRFRQITVAGMLVTTNDAFFSGTGAARSKPESLRAIAFDAGSEGNTESCEHIPGPPCGNPGERVTESAEGYVHVHAGVHGGQDLMPANHDWRNPVAYVTIQRAD
jgi:hypothetical protein